MSRPSASLTLLLLPLLALSCGESAKPPVAPPAPSPPEAPAVPAPIEPAEPAAPVFEAQHFETVDVARPMLEAAKTVGALIAARGCSTGPSAPLNAQIAMEINCARPDAFRSIAAIPNVTFNPGANPFLQREAALALERVARAHPSGTLALNSTWRSPVQQHILKSWEGSCGIGVAARPGNSLHESGQAIDVPLETLYGFHAELKEVGWRWYCDARAGGYTNGCKDVPHFTWAEGDDLRSLGIAAFQRLWNRAHPKDRISTSGALDRATRKRLQGAPLAGFEDGASCAGSNAALFGTCPILFADVPTEHSYYEPITRCAYADVLDPELQTADYYRPGDGVTRLEFARVLARALELEDTPVDLAGAFEDTDEAAPRLLKAIGVTGGCDKDGRLFCPDAPVNWAQAAAMLARARNLSVRSPEGQFEDVPIDHWAAPYVEAVTEAGFMPPCKDDKARFCPDWRLSRARMAWSVATTFDLPGLGPCRSASIPPEP